MTLPPTGPLGSIATLRDVVSGRTSSWDRSGRNEDCWVILPGESVTIADLPGPGTITHLWMTQWSFRILGPGWEEPDPDLLRTLVLRATWDDASHPAVLVPLGDFFCLGDGIAASFSSLPFTASANPPMERRRSGHVSLNSYLPMPFGSRAVLEVLNEGAVAVGLYFHVDFELQAAPLPADTGRLHASWRRETRPAGWGPDIEPNSPAAQVAANLSWEENFRILDVEGDGQYVGCNLTVVHARGERRGRRPGEATWWGEGDDMIVVDGEPWPPRLHGTGSEDYFGHAWEMQPVAYPMTGSVVHERDVPGVQVSYRFHLVDPIRFRRSILVTMERGHANHLADDWSATAYWYQRSPAPILTLPPVAERRPSGARVGLAPEPDPTVIVGLSEELRSIRLAAAAATSEALTVREVDLRRRAAATRKAEAASRGEVRALRSRTLGDAGAGAVRR